MVQDQLANINLLDSIGLMLKMKIRTNNVYHKLCMKAIYNFEIIKVKK